MFMPSIAMNKRLAVHASLSCPVPGQRANNQTSIERQLTLVAADLAVLRRLIRAVRATVTLGAAEVARARERTLYAGVRAVGLVVPNFATVVALPSQAPTALTPGLGAVTREVTVGAAAASTSVSENDEVSEGR